MESKSVDRRHFLKATGKAGIAAGFSAAVLPALAADAAKTHLNIPAAGTPYTQQPLPYSYSALEPYIDATTMELHYSKHAAGYAKNLAEAVAAEHVDTGTTTLEALLANISQYSTKMRNNAGGHYNHELFWKLMAPASGKSALPEKLTAALTRDFGSPENLKTQFNDAAKARFGSGWAWLIYTNDKKFAIASTPNQDNPLMNVSDARGFPVLGIDVWEHAYYLKYHNLRADYINAWWNLVNWQWVAERWNSIA